MAKLSFFIGKGGVGKTTVSSAYAVSAATARPSQSILLLSTDPAHSLADIFELRFHDRRTQVKLSNRAKLYVSQVDASGRFNKFLDEHRELILDLVEQGTFFTRREIGLLLDSTMPGMAEISALISIYELVEADEYDEIVIDTAPMGHTLRLFELPQQFLSFLTFLDLAGSRDTLLAQRFGGVPKSGLAQSFVAQWRRMVGKVQQALISKDTQLVLVTSAEKFSLHEAVRGSESLGAMDAKLRFSKVVLNRVVDRPGSCPACIPRHSADERAKKFIVQNFPCADLLTGSDIGEPVLGALALREFGESVFHGKARKLPSGLAKAEDIELVEVGWPVLNSPLSLTIGKGGVGKTTVSAALACGYRAVHKSRTIAVCSTDPAPSLGDVFKKTIGESPVPVLNDPRLQALELDSVAEYQRWAEPLKRRLYEETRGQDGRVYVDLSFEFNIFSALLDIVPPGVDEIFAVFRIADLIEAEFDAVIIDMAPTGHALELLRTPARVQEWTRLLLKTLSAHRSLPMAKEIGVEVATVGQRVRRLAQILKDQKQSRLFTVMLAEPLPDRQTSRLMATLRGLELNSGTLFVNRVLVAEGAGGCRRCVRARNWQIKTLKSLRGQAKDLEILIAPNFNQEIAGAKLLKMFTQRLWRMA